MIEAQPTILLTGATGFVGGAVRPALAGMGWHVRCLTRDAAQAHERQPGLDWVEGDVADATSCARALDGCQAALYLVHGIGEGADYHRREVAAATTFSQAAAAAGVERIVYLGGVAPAGAGLRAPAQPTRGGRDAAGRPGQDHRAAREHDRRARQPQLAHRARSGGPVAGHGAAAVAEVAHAAGRHRRRRDRARAGARPAARRPAPVSICPDRLALSGKEILEETARVMGLPHPRMLEVPLLSPRLSSLWVRFVTRAKWSVAREVVVGLADDLLAAR